VFSIRLLSKHFMLTTTKKSSLSMPFFINSLPLTCLSDYFVYLSLPKHTTSLNSSIMQKWNCMHEKVDKNEWIFCWIADGMKKLRTVIQAWKIIFVHVTKSLSYFFNFAFYSSTQLLLALSKNEWVLALKSCVLIERFD